MNHETLQALYALDVAEVGEDEAAKRWDSAMYGQWKPCGKSGPDWTAQEYRRKPGIPWPKVMRPDTKPEWPADAPEWANYMATDANGRCMVFENKPVIQPTGRFWDTNLGRRDVFTIRNYPGWEPSLIERPKPLVVKCQCRGQEIVE